MIDAQVTARTQETADIISVELARTDGAALPSFSAGAHIDVQLPTGWLRQYSLCRVADSSGRYQIAVLKDAASRGGSLAMHAHLTVGAHVQISAPRNLFALHPTASRSLLFAGGIGITPLLCMAQSLADAGADFTLHYCARSPDRAAFLAQLRASAFVGNVHCHFDDGEAGQRLHAAQALAHPDRGTHVYVCGPAGFMQEVLDTASALGWPAENLHREYFVAAPAAAGSEAGDGSFEIALHSTGQIFTVPADKTVAQVLDENGIFISLACEQGLCGTCITGVLEGQPAHRDQFQTDEERALNTQFTPCCSRALSGRLVLDL